MLKNYNYMLTILLYPFILILSYLELTKALNSKFYLYLLIIMIIIFIPSFIMSLYCVLDDILNSKHKWRIILVILFSIFYIPFYYTKYISKQERYLGVIIPIITILLTVVTYYATIKELGRVFSILYEDYAVVNDHYTYTSVDNLIQLSVDKSFRCESNKGDYIVSCDRLEDDSFIGIYSYDITEFTEEEIEDILDFHIKQTIDYIKEKDFEYEIDNSESIIRIYYQNMVILLTQNNYIVDDSNYSLIILKEVPRDLLNEKEFQKMIESIEFLNYNNGMSS